MRLLAALLLLPASVAWSQDRYSRQPVGPPPDPNGGGATAASDMRDLLGGFESPPGGQGGSQPASELPAAQPLDSPGTAQPSQPPVGTPPNTYTGEPSYGTSASAAAEPPARTSATVDTDYAKRLMDSALTPPSNTQLSGTPVFLPEVVAPVGSRSEQSECIGAYWDLCSAVSDYYLSLREQNDLQNLVARGGQTPLLQQALSKLEKRRDTALSAARASQRRLASLMNRDQSAPLPLPGDMPLCAGYHTRYSQYFPTDNSPEAAELNQLLPLRHAELLESAAAVSQAEKYFNSIADRPMNDQGVELLMQLEGLALKRRAFVQIARDYNKRVARYTELARPGDVGANRLVSMLIKTNGSVASRTSSPTRPSLRDRSESAPPHTFQQDANPLNSTAPRLDEEVMTTSGEEPNMVEKIAPGEVSVLRRRNAE
ncbi:hypothetical protein NG895_20835 [Aeoliella sp. ICT_H6.2]|uniref:Uncharacterized protein n=1 Tax=Aeoliella straminimaris TaxID=2954799 RepID=A0A9X2FDR9_9BACT|nr:hypothetical protein [Aeoliella straminimaris]MCO6046353.1 hypothetical protein [Aeoliella straminimaris]